VAVVTTLSKDMTCHVPCAMLLRLLLLLFSTVDTFPPKLSVNEAFPLFSASELSRQFFLAASVGLPAKNHRCRCVPMLMTTTTMLDVAATDEYLVAAAAERISGFHYHPFFRLDIVLSIGGHADSLRCFRRCSVGHHRRDQGALNVLRWPKCLAQYISHL